MAVELLRFASVLRLTNRPVCVVFVRHCDAMLTNPSHVLSEALLEAFATCPRMAPAMPELVRMIRELELHTADALNAVCVWVKPLVPPVEPEINTTEEAHRAGPAAAAAAAHSQPSVAAAAVPVSSEYRDILDTMKKGFEDMNHRFVAMVEAMDKKFEAMDKKFEARFDAMDKRLDRIMPLISAEKAFSRLLKYATEQAAQRDVKLVFALDQVDVIGTSLKHTSAATDIMRSIASATTITKLSSSTAANSSAFEMISTPGVEKLIMPPDPTRPDCVTVTSLADMKARPHYAAVTLATTADMKMLLAKPRKSTEDEAAVGRWLKEQRDHADNVDEVVRATSIEVDAYLKMKLDHSPEDLLHFLSVWPYRLGQEIDETRRSLIDQRFFSYSRDNELQAEGLIPYVIAAAQIRLKYRDVTRVIDSALRYRMTVVAGLRSWLMMLDVPRQVCSPHGPLWHAMHRLGGTAVAQLDVRPPQKLQEHTDVFLVQEIKKAQRYSICMVRVVAETCHAHVNSPSSRAFLESLGPRVADVDLDLHLCIVGPGERSPNIVLCTTTGGSRITLDYFEKYTTPLFETPRALAIQQMRRITAFSPRYPLPSRRLTKAPMLPTPGRIVHASTISQTMPGGAYVFRIDGIADTNVLVVDADGRLHVTETGDAATYVWNRNVDEYLPQLAGYFDTVVYHTTSALVVADVDLDMDICYGQLKSYDANHHCYGDGPH